MTKLNIDNYANKVKNISGTKYSPGLKKLVKANYLHYDKILTRMKSRIESVDTKHKLLYSKLQENPLTMIGATLTKDFLLLMEKFDLEQELLARFDTKKAKVYTIASDKAKKTKISNLLRDLFDDVNATSSKDRKKIHLSVKQEIIAFYKNGKDSFKNAPEAVEEVNNYVDFVNDLFGSFYSSKSEGYRDITKLPVIAVTSQKNIVYGFKGRKSKSLLWVSIEFEKKQELLLKSNYAKLDNDSFNVFEVSGFNLNENLKTREITPGIDKELFKMSYLVNKENIDIIYNEKGILDLELSDIKINSETNLKEVFKKEVLRAGEKIDIDIDLGNTSGSEVYSIPAHLFNMVDEGDFKKALISSSFNKLINDSLAYLRDTRKIDINNDEHILFFKLINSLIYKGYKYKFLKGKEVINYFNNIDIMSGSYAAFISFIPQYLKQIKQVDLNKNIEKAVDLEELFNRSMLVASKELRDNSSVTNMKKGAKEVFKGKEYNSLNFDKYLAYLSTLNSELSEYLDVDLLKRLNKKVSILKRYTIVKSNDPAHKTLFNFLQVIVSGHYNGYLSDDFHLDLIKDIELGENVYNQMITNHNFRKVVKDTIKIDDNKYEDKFRLLNEELAKAESLLAQSSDKVEDYNNKLNKLNTKYQEDVIFYSKEIIQKNKGEEQSVIDDLIYKMKEPLLKLRDDEIKTLRKRSNFYLWITLFELVKVKSSSNLAGYLKDQPNGAWSYIKATVGKHLKGATSISNKDGNKVFYSILSTIAKLSYKQSYDKLDVLKILKRLEKLISSDVYKEQIELFKQKIFQNRGLLEKSIEKETKKVFQNIDSSNMEDSEYVDLMKSILRESKIDLFGKRKTNIDTFLRVYNKNTSQFEKIEDAWDIEDYSRNVIEPLLKENVMMGIKLLFALFHKIYFIEIATKDLTDAFKGFEKLDNVYFNLLSVLLNSVEEFSSLGSGDTDQNELLAVNNYKQVSSRLVDGFMANPNDYVFANCEALSYKVSSRVCSAFNSMISEIFNITDSPAVTKSNIDLGMEDGSSSQEGEIVDNSSNPEIKYLEKENDVILLNNFLDLVESNTFNVNIYKQPSLYIQEDNSIKLIFIELMSMISDFYEKGIPARQAVYDFYEALKEFDAKLSLVQGKGLLKTVLRNPILNILTLDPQDNGSNIVKNIFRVFTEVFDNDFKLIPLSSEIEISDVLKQDFKHIRSIFHNYSLSKEIIESRKEAFFVDSDKVVFLKELNLSGTSTSFINPVASAKSKAKTTTSSAIDMIISTLSDNGKDVAYLVNNGILLDKFIQPNGKEIYRKHNLSSRFDKALLYFQKRLYNSPIVIDMMFLLSSVFTIADKVEEEIKKSRGTILNKIDDQMSEFLMESYLSEDGDLSTDLTIDDVKDLSNSLTHDKLYQIFLNDILRTFDDDLIDDKLFESVSEVMSVALTSVKDYMFNTMTDSLNESVNSSIRNKVFKLGGSKRKENSSKADMREKLFELFNSIDEDFIELIVAINEKGSVEGVKEFDDAELFVKTTMKKNNEEYASSSIEGKEGQFFAIVNELGGLLTDKDIKNQMYSIIEDFKVNLPSIINSIEKSESLDIINVGDAFTSVVPEIYNLQVDAVITEMLVVDKVYDYWAAREIFSKISDEMDKDISGDSNNINEGRLNINQVNENDGSNALHRTIMGSHYEMAKKLIKLGININLADDEGITPIVLSILSSDINMTKLLYNSKASLESSSNLIVDKLTKEIQDATNEDDIDFWSKMLREVELANK